MLRMPRECRRYKKREKCEKYVPKQIDETERVKHHNTQKVESNTKNNQEQYLFGNDNFGYLHIIRLVYTMTVTDSSVYNSPKLL